MSQSVFIGAALIAVSAYHLIPAILTGEIPATWPVKPLTRSGKPKEFWVTFGAMVASGTIGAIMILWSS